MLLCDGSAIGQEIRIRKNVVGETFDHDIFIKVKHLDLEDPNKICDIYTMVTSAYCVSFVWDGAMWLEVN